MPPSSNVTSSGTPRAARTHITRLRVVRGATSGNAVRIAGLSFALLFVLVVLPPPATLTGLTALPPTPPAFFAAITVNSTADGPVATDGACTLREAITAANANLPSGDCPAGSGADTISFNIPAATDAGCNAGTGVCTISPSSALPTITDPATIDGYTQPGSSVNTLATGDDAALKIELDGTFAGAGINGLVITAGLTTVRGLVINSFGGAGVRLQGGGDFNVVTGCFIGTDANGTAGQGNSDGVSIQGPGTTDNRVGGTAPAERNVISGNDDDGLAGLSQSATVVQGNYIGTDKNGTAPLGNGGEGLLLQCSNCVVGGASPAAGNVVSASGGFGIEVLGNGNTIQGNYIGTDAGGTSDLGNGVSGIYLNASTNTTVGGPSALAGVAPGNLISGNAFHGIQLIDASGTLAQGNNFGANAARNGPIGNGVHGVFILSASGSSANLIGGPGAGEANLVAFNGGDGVAVEGDGALGNRFLANSVHTNAALGIDLGNVPLTSDGPTPNDQLDPDAGPNRLQNYPVLTNVSTSGGSTTATGSLNSTPNSTFRVEFFSNQSCDPSGFGEGQTFLAARTVTTDAAGNAVIGESFTPAVPASRFLTATATVTDDPADATNDDNTSEFSPCRQELAAAQSFAVNSTGDLPDNSPGDGLCSTGGLVGVGPECTLRAAIQEANVNPSADTINFNIPAATDAGCVLGTGVCTISPASALPAVSQPATINGYSQPASAENTLAAGDNADINIELNGAGAGAGVDGLSITGGSSTVRGLAIYRFGGDGIDLSTNGGNTVAGNFIGTNATGAGTTNGNGGDGVNVSNVASNTVGGPTPQARNLISANAGEGIDISGTGASGNVVAGNYIGTDRNGTADVGNLNNGVFLAGPTNTVGGSTATPGAGAGNVISGNALSGVRVTTGGNSNTVAGNLVGLQSNGTTALRNDLEGVFITNTASSNTVGGATSDLRNVISGHTATASSDGVEINGAGTNSNVVAGNYIGTNAAGTSAVPNTDGVRIAAGAQSSTVGGSAATPGAAPGNVISGNSSDGVEITGAGSSSNNVRGNLIGLRPGGAVAQGNTAAGVNVTAGASSNAVGGATSDLRNVISANGDGVVVNGASGNTVAGNYVGTDSGGTVDLGNTTRGVFLAAGAQSNTVGGLAATPGAAPGNVISGNNSDGVEITGSTSSSNNVRGNLVGLAAGGTALLRNGTNNNGVFINAADSNTVGGTTATARNVITGGTSVNSDGVDLQNGSDNNVISGNYIGTDINGAGSNGGASDFGSGGDGVRIASNSDANTVGGSATGAGNVIAGNGGDGVEVAGSGSSNNAVQGNFIGTQAGGTTAYANGANGVLITATSASPVNTVGGSTPTPGAGAGNVISGNTANGVQVSTNADGTLIRGNLIGLAAGGAAALGNGANGVLLTGTINGTVGGATSDLRNVISANGSDGVELASGGHTVQGNYIGTQSDGTSALGNMAHGVFVSAATTTATAVGGTAAGASNTIAFNGGDGVFNPLGVNVQIRRNSIHSNAGLGIDLGADGVTPNDTDDPDAGANNLQNFPVITDARTGSTVITGTLNSTPSTTFTVEFFSSQTPDPTAHGEGQTFLDSVSVTTDAGGDAAFTHTAAATVPTGHVITATAIDPAGNTSEFSNTRQMLAATAARLRSFKAKAYGVGVLLEWQTSFEVDNLGFNLYREDGGRRVLVTPELVAGSALTAGQRTVLTAGNSYTWIDRAGDASSRYWLEAVSTDGTSAETGPYWATTSARKGQRLPGVSRSPSLDQLGADSAESTGTQQQRHQWSQPSVASGGGKGGAAVSSAAAASAASTGRQRELAANPAVKLSVRRGGWYRVTRAQLEAAGLSPAADPARLRLYTGGVECAVRLDHAAWASGGGAVEFYGEGLDTPSADTRVYWLVEGQGAGRRLIAGGQSGGTIPPATGGSRPPPSRGAGTVTGFSYTAERRDRTIYFSSLLNGETENFFGRVVGGATGTQTLDVRHPDTAATDANPPRLEVALQGVTAGAHRVSVVFNGTALGSIEFKGRERRSASFSVARWALREGGNDVSLTSGGASDVSLTDYLRLTYKRQYRADSDALRFTAGGGEAVRVSHFTTPDVRVVDITDPFNVSDVAATVERPREGEGYSVSLKLAGSGAASRRTLYAYAGAGGSRQVEAAVANRPSSWRESREADFVIITHGDFGEAVAPLAARRASEGLATEVVDVEDIYDEFSFGAHSPQAIKDFLAWTARGWARAPRFVLLVGDGSYDPRNYMARGAFDLVPAKLLDTAYMETASDNWYADFDGDGLSEMAVGRLPLRSASEAAVVLAKIEGHEPGGAEESALLVSDRRGADGYDFEAATDQLQSLLPESFAVQRVNRGAQGAETVRGQVVGGINDGPFIVNWMGHGSVNVWTGEGLLRSEDAARLTNGGRLPLFVMMTCLNGYYHDPALDSLSESLLKAAGGGALAVWTSTGMTEPTGQADMNRELYRALFGAGGGPLRLGEAMQRARTATADPDVRRTWVLIGDPTTRVR